MTGRRPPRLLDWFGGKARVTRALCALDLPRFENYHEPFLGSGAAFLGLASAGVISKGRLSDLNPWLVNVFRAVQAQHGAVVSCLRMHELLDSDVHYAAVLGRLNARPMTDAAAGPPDGQAAADTIYLLARSVRASWYETLDGRVSMARKRTAGSFRARHQDVVRAATLLQDATVRQADFRSALAAVGPGDLVFLDPPYLRGSDTFDKQGYNTERFTAADLRALSDEMRRMVDLGAQVIFCWGEPNAAVVAGGGAWLRVGKEFVWLSEGLRVAGRADTEAQGHTVTTKAEEGAAQDPKRVSEAETDIARLVAARDRDLKDAWERDVIDAPDWSDLISTEDAVLDALGKVEKEEEDAEASDSNARRLLPRRS